MLIVSLKIIYVTTLLCLFTYYFGLQSFILYSERRMMFTDEMIDFRQDKPPAILIAHTPTKPKNVDTIKSCLNVTIKENIHNEEKEYEEALKCIDKNLKNKTEIFVDLKNEKEFLKDFETVKIGIHRFMSSPSPNLSPKPKDPFRTEADFIIQLGYPTPPIFKCKCDKF